MTVPFYVPPEQLMKDRAEYARKGIARGKSIAAVEYADGILLVAENPSGTLHKIGEIYDRIAFAGAGKYSEFETLRVAGIRHADLKGYSYARTDVTAKSLANAYSHALGQIFTQEVKPYEVGIMLAEVGDTTAGNLLFKVTYDGTLSAEDHVAVIGGQEEQLAALLRQSYRPDAPLAEAVQWAVAAFLSAAGRTFEPTEWEAAVVDRTLGRRAFRRLAASEMGGA
jgi:proteasome alpha subunit